MDNKEHLNIKDDNENHSNWIEIKKKPKCEWSVVSNVALIRIEWSANPNEAELANNRMKKRISQITRIIKEETRRVVKTDNGISTWIWREREIWDPIK